MSSLRMVLALALLAAPAMADEAARKFEVAAVAKVDGSKVHWIQGDVDVTLPAGWTVDEDTGKKDDDLQLQNGEKNYYALLTTADSEDYKLVGQKMVEGMSSSGNAKDPKQEGTSEATVAGNKAQKILFSVTMSDTRLKYVVTSFAANGKSYILTSFSGADAFDAAVKDFDAIGESFKIAKAAADASLNGSWDLVGMNVEGKDAPADALKGMVLTVDGAKYSLKQADKEVENGTIKIAGNTIDWNIEFGPDKGKLQKGIFKLDGANLTFANARAGAEARPTALTPGPEQAIATLKKKI